MAQHVFPDSLKERSAYPTIRFSVDGTAESIYLPIPQGLTFGDNMNYSTIDLGVIGDMAQRTIEQFAKEGAKSGFGTLAGGVMDKLKSMNAEAAAVIASTALASEGTTQIVGLGIKKILPPNTNSIFQGSAIRQFGFQFKLVARTQSEAKTAKAIVDVFRKYMYPEGTQDNILLSYPNTWKITFHQADLPKIAQCYLTSLSTTYNSSTNAFYSDNSPLETDINLTFQETKALNRTMLEKLNRGESNL